MKLNEITHKINGCAMKMHNTGAYNLKRFTILNTMLDIPRKKVGIKIEWIKGFTG